LTKSTPALGDERGGAGAPRSAHGDVEDEDDEDDDEAGDAGGGGGGSYSGPAGG
jgi:hypothetical protein